MEDDLPVDCSGAAVPVCGLSQVRDFLQVVHAVQVREHLLGMSEEEREEVVHMSGALNDVRYDDVQVNGEVLRLHAKSPEVGERLLLEVD